MAGKYRSSDDAEEGKSSGDAGVVDGSPCGEDRASGGAVAEGGGPSEEWGACGEAGSSEARMPAVADVTIADSVACLCSTFEWIKTEGKIRGKHRHHKICL